MNIKQSVNAQFSNVAANYKTSTVHATGHDLQRMGDLISGSQRVLDLGCGAGHASLAVAATCGQVIAYDLSDAMLAQVRELCAERDINNVTTRQGDVEQLPFADNEFDAIVTRYSAHHWPQPEVALTEARRVLKPGGTLLVCDGVAPNNYAADSFLQCFEILRDPSHVREHTVAQWQMMLRNAGFTPTVEDEWQMQITFEKWVTRMATPEHNVEMIRRLFVGSSAEIQLTFDIQPNQDFKLLCALLSAS